MSYFPDHDCILEDQRVDTDRAEGVTLERRSLLRISASTAALALAACGSTQRGRSGGSPSEPAESASQTPLETPPALADGTLEIGEFLTEMYPRALRCIDSGGTREESYLMAIGELMTRVRVPDDQTLQVARNEFREAQEGDVREIMVLAFSFKPGKGFSHHDHRDYNGVIMGVEGEVRCRNFDILGDDPVPPKGETFQIRETRNDLILPGRFSTLARNRDNVHEVVAGPEGGRVLDVFTYFERGARSYFMDVDEQPRDAERGIFDAAWS